VWIQSFFDVKRRIHLEFVPPNTVVNSGFYYDVLRLLRENVRRKRPDLDVTTTGSFVTTVCPHIPENHRVC
jgi:hypothetical protein